MLKMKLRRLPSVLLLMLAALLLCGCLGTSSKANLSALQALVLPQSAELLLLQPINTETMRIDDEAQIELTYLALPKNLDPVGQIDVHSGYLFDAERKNMLLYRYDTETHTTAVSLEQLQRTFGPEIAFNQRWLIWVEVGALFEQPNGGLGRECWLMARDLASDDVVVFQLDHGGVTAAEGIFLPFDSLSIDQSSLVYRRSTFHGGWRDTEVRLIDLEEGTSQTLQVASGSGGRMVLTCSIASRMAVWDVQYAREAQLTGLPPQQLVSYDLYCYQLDPEKLDRNEHPLKQISMNRAYHAPCVFVDQIVALEERPETGSNVAMRQHLILIHPLLLNRKELVHMKTPFYRSEALGPDEILEGMSQGLLADYVLNEIPRSVSFSAPRVMRRFLSWQSNIPDQRMVFDFNFYGLLELPLFFENETIQETEYISRALPSLEADYLLFETLDGGERYILRLE